MSGDAAANDDLDKQLAAIKADLIKAAPKSPRFDKSGSKKLEKAS